MSNILNIGASGLFAAKKSLEVTGHNLSNANTEGYSRQRVNQTTNPPLSKGGLISGTGTRIDNIGRISDKYITKRLEQSVSRFNHFKERAERLEQVENLFSEVDSDGLNKMLTKFFNSFRELAAQPENETIRSVVRDSAALLIEDFRRMSEGLDDLEKTVNARVDAEVLDINHILENVAKLNRRIRELETLGDQTGDLRDQRDLAVKELSKSFEVHTFSDEKGLFNVSAKGVGSLVSGVEVQPLAVGIRVEKTDDGHDIGRQNVYYKSRSSNPITNSFKKGRLKAMLEVRDKDAASLRKEVDGIAFDLANLVNAIHRRGQVSRPKQSNLDGRSLASSQATMGPVTGIDFFSIPLERHRAASMIDLSDAVKSDLSNITTALTPNSPGDNRISLAISKIQHEKVLEGGTTTIEEHFLQTVANLGIESGKAKLDRDQQEGIQTQINGVRERISGVSIDEETANMVRYQHAYEASARIMRTAGEMFDTVLGIMK